MAYTKAQLLALESKIDAITGFHKRALLDSEWKGLASTDFTPSASLTYLTTQEFADSRLNGYLTFYVNPRVPTSIGVPPSPPTS
jgi:hypothetical protein